jgi:hypothetical protein
VVDQTPGRRLQRSVRLEADGEPAQRPRIGQGDDLDAEHRGDRTADLDRDHADPEIRRDDPERGVEVRDHDPGRHTTRPTRPAARCSMM